MTPVMRMFRWKQILICAESIEDAWKAVVEAASYADHSDPASDLTAVAAFEKRETRYFESAFYDDINPRDYLAAIDPEEALDIDAGHLPRLDHVDGKVPVLVHDTLFDAELGVLVHGEARMWATVLPAGWTHVPDRG